MQRLLCLALALALCVTLAAAAAAEDMADQVKSSCASCHSTKRVCTRLGNDQAYWQKTIQRMVDIGTQMPANAVEPMAAYLAGQTKAAAPFCK